MAERGGDEEIERRLASALQQELRSGHVDVADLLRGTRRRTQRAKVRRAVVLAAAATAVVAVPIGYAVAQQGGPSSVQAASPTPTDLPSASGAPTAEPTPIGSTPTEPTDAPTGPTPTGTRPADLPEATVPSPVARYGIPKAVMPTVKEIGRGSAVTYADDDPNGPTLMGQACGQIPEARRPLERRTQSTSNDAKGSFQVDVVVTGWRDSEAAFRSLVEDAGSCRLSPGMEWSAQQSAGLDDYAATGTSNGLQYGFAARRMTGDVVVAVTVIDSDRASALAEARRVAALVAVRAVNAGIAQP